MRGLEKNRMKRDRQTDRHTYNGHRDSMIESAQWADLMKMDDWFKSNDNVKWGADQIGPGGSAK